jgi:hypothetical protein
MADPTNSLYKRPSLQSHSRNDEEIRERPEDDDQVVFETGED